MNSKLVVRSQKRQLLISSLVVAVFLSLGICLTMVKTVTIIVDQDTRRITTWKTHVDSALAEAGITLFEGDVVEPALNEKLSRGMEILVKRSFPVNVLADGKEYEVRSIGETVADILDKAEIVLGPLDHVEPGVDHLVTANESIAITRITKEEIVVEEEIPHGSKQWAEPTLEKGKTKVVRQGQAGLRQQIYEVTYENGQEVHRQLVQTLVVREARDEIIGLGTREVWNTLTTSRGAIRYRALHEMTATAYYPGPESTGKWADGYTATGVKAGFGIAAVDPKVIPLGTRLYIPGYGHALAADVGGAIKGKRIDLCFETYQEAIQYGRRKVKVYILD